MNSLRTRLGPLTLESPVVLAPMAGYTDSPMRRLARRYGASLVFSEMLSAEATIRQNEKTLNFARFTPEERPIVLQYFAASPSAAAEVAKILEEIAPDGLDLNFGCPVRKIVQNSGGAALLKDIPLLGKIVEATVKATRLPVSAKIRCGWDEQSRNAVEASQAIADNGASWVTVHARTRSEFRKGSAHWDWIGEVKQKVSIPVIGNGDVKTAEDAVALQKLTGCDAVMIGRRAFGNPFIFREANALFSGVAPLAPPTPRERFQVMNQQLEWMVECFGEECAVRRFRKHAIAYLRELPNSSTVKNKIVSLPRADEVISVLRDYLLSLPSELESRSLTQGEPVKTIQGI
jgi:tRNA-dihydrouridine synthase B